MERAEVVEDGRTQAAAVRREKTRKKFIESALAVFAEKGPDAAQIDDFIAAAGVARGTFYNYFRTTAELLMAVAGEVSDEVIQVVDPAVLTIDDPAARMAAGCRLYMQMAVRYPLWGAFIARVGTKRGSWRNRLDDTMTRDLERGIRMGRFVDVEIMAARDISLGAVMYGIESLLSGETPRDYAEQVIVGLLRALGISPGEARQIAYGPLPTCSTPKAEIFQRIESIGVVAT